MQYRLNPLAKHLYLIPFDNKRTGKTDWTLVWGIEATRLVARRAARKHKISFGYIDFSPRSMTEAEQMKINGKLDDSKIWAITILRDDKGNDCFGVGFWPKDKAIQGADKGNTPENMARIRSERNALNRLLPGEMPGDEVEIEDEAYLEKPVIKVLADAELCDCVTAVGTEVTGEDIPEQGEGAPVQPEEKPEPPKPLASYKELVSDAQRKAIFVIGKKAGMTDDNLKEIIHGKFPELISTKELTKGQASQLIEYLNTLIPLEEKGSINL
jgi:hypothetical protein